MKKATLSFVFLWALFLGLMLSFTASTLIWVPETRVGGVGPWLVHVLPLLIFAPGLWRGAIRNQVWLCFVILLYFCGAVVNAFRPDAYIVDALEILLTVLLFCAGTGYIRWASRAARQSQQTATQTEASNE